MTPAHPPRMVPHREPLDAARGGGVLVGFDGSCSSEHALAYAAGIAARLRAELLIVHVTRIPLTVYPYGAFLPRLPASDGLTEAVDELLGPCEVPWRLIRRWGAVERELLAAARQLQADVVVVGKSRHRLRRVGGSIGSRLTRHCERPLVVIP